MAHFKQQDQLARALGCSPSSLSKLRKKHADWFPLPGPFGWDLVEVQAAIAQNLRACKLQRLCLAALATPAAAAPVKPTIDPEGETMAALVAATEPLEIAKANVKLLSKQLEEAVRSNNPSSVLVDALNKSLTALRQNEEAYLTLAVRRHELIEIDVARAVIGEIVKILAVLLKRFTNELPNKFETVHIDQAYWALSADERKRRTRNWSDDIAGAFRQVDAEAILQKHIQQDSI